MQRQSALLRKCVRQSKLCYAGFFCVLVQPSGCLAFQEKLVSLLGEQGLDAPELPVFIKIAPLASDKDLKAGFCQGKAQLVVLLPILFQKYLGTAAKKAAEHSLADFRKMPDQADAVNLLAFAAEQPDTAAEASISGLLMAAVGAAVPEHK